METLTSKKEDYSYVAAPARIAIYDDLKSSPKIIEIKANETKEFIGLLSSEVYRYSKEAGGKIAYSVIKQICENYIHANFKEMVVSIMEEGNVIKFSDQGPGIENKEAAILPGFSSANSEMKKYIDGVGSGLPIACEYMQSSAGTLKIEDNISSGSVITLSLNKNNKESISLNLKKERKEENIYLPLVEEISSRGKLILSFLKEQKIAGVKDVVERYSFPNSSVHSEFIKLENLNLVKKIGTKRSLSPLGEKIVENFESYQQ